MKHRTPNYINFNIAQPGGHILFVLTLAGAGRPDSLCRIDVQALCAACSKADLAVVG
jgi:hypothetical protein